ncbi:MAG: NAD-dependent epimerase/dehydratase family protein [Actinomycetota bacterium]|nr:NAD-dependent epimerase/dehydratase family protein [Actinomycetota bacterium]
MLTAVDSELDGPVLVTGGCGFIGRAVVRALLDTQTEVTVVDRVSPDSRTDGVRYVVGELGDGAVADSAVAPGTAAVIHLAAATSVLRSVQQPVQTYADNVAVTQQLLEVARTRSVGQFLLASTNAVVGNVGEAVITERLPLRPLTPYGATKAACEMLLSGYAGAYGMTTCALRFSNVYGPGMALKDSFVPRLMRAALDGSTVTIYGDGTQRRDLVHVDDVARAVLLGRHSRYTGTAIVGAGCSVSVLDLVEAVRAVTGKPLPTRHVEPQQGEMPAVVVDVAHSAEAIGYRPTVGLAEGLESTWRYFLDNVGA